MRALSLLLVCFLCFPCALCQEGKVPEAWINKLKWRCIGPANMGGRIIDIEVSKQDFSVWWAATASGGLLKTCNNGITFEHQFDHEATVSIGDLAVAPTDHNILWVGTGESNPRNSVSWGDGVYKSTDGGKTWKNMGLKKSFQIGRIRIHQENPDIVYVGALGRLWGENKERGLYKTNDGGKTWEQILYIDEKTGVVDLIMHPEDSDTLIVATYERQRDGFDTNDPKKKMGPGAGLYKTTDGGKTFEKLTQGLPTCNLGRIGLDWYVKDPNQVYAIVESEKIAKAPENAPYLGVSGSDVEVGAKITEVVEEGPSDKAGLKANDIVVSINDDTVHSYQEFIRLVRGYQAGDTVKIEVSREQKSVVMDLTFEKKPEAIEDPDKKKQTSSRRRRSGTFSSGLGGQRQNIQDQQGKDGHEFGGLYHSQDGGLTWKRINSVNPRPMYFSKIRVDPSDNKYIYVLGISLYRSKDGGKTFTSDGGRNVHSDNHGAWVNPRDGRHIILGTDGGIYVTYDRMDNWDILNHMAIGQFYHVAVDPRPDYTVYGGLQDNGSWGGPGRSRNRDGILNEDWFMLGWGDGFICRVDPEDPDQLYYESQNGNMGRYNLRTGERGYLRPKPPRGTRYRFNWKTPHMLSHHNSRIFYAAGNHVFRSLSKGDNLKAISPEITNTDKGSATVLGESHFDPHLLYVGTDDGALWRTQDNGHTWEDLFNFELKQEVQEAPEEKAPEEIKDHPLLGRWVIKRENPEMEGANEPSTLVVNKKEGKLTGELTTPYGKGEILDAKFDKETKTLTFGFDSGGMSLDVTGKITSKDKMTGSLDFEGGAFTMDFTGKRETAGPVALEENKEKPKEKEASKYDWKPLKDLAPKPLWVSSMETSRFQKGRLYLTLDGHRSDDDAPYLYVSENKGETWRSIVSNLPENAGSAKALREDIKNPNILYLGTEFFAFVSVDRGASWTKFNSNLPTVAVHDFAQHPTEGVIIAGTHGRSLWVLDVTVLRRMQENVFLEKATLFQPNKVAYWRTNPSRGGDLRRFVGKNPAEEAQIFYLLKEKARRVSLKICDATGEVIRELEASNEKGFHRVTWDLRKSPQEGSRRYRRSPRVSPGKYTIQLKADKTTLMETLEITGDPVYKEAVLWGEAHGDSF